MQSGVQLLFSGVWAEDYLGLPRQKHHPFSCSCYPLKCKTGCLHRSAPHNSNSLLPHESHHHHHAALHAARTHDVQPLFVTLSLQPIRSTCLQKPVLTCGRLAQLPLHRTYIPACASLSAPQLATHWNGFHSWTDLRFLIHTTRGHLSRQRSCRLAQVATAGHRHRSPIAERFVDMGTTVFALFRLETGCI